MPFPSWQKTATIQQCVLVVILAKKEMPDVSLAVHLLKFHFDHIKQFPLRFSSRHCLCASFDLWVKKSSDFLIFLWYFNRCYKMSVSDSTSAVSSSFHIHAVLRWTRALLTTSSIVEITWPACGAPGRLTRDMAPSTAQLIEKVVLLMSQSAESWPVTN